MVILICNLYKTAEDLLPHFYNHYRRWGVDEFMFGIWEGEKNPLWDYVKNTYPDIRLFKSYDGEITSQKEGESHRYLKSQLGGMDDWYVPTDLDEFHVFPWASSFSEAVELCKNEGADYVEGKTMDRITSDGSIPPTIDPSINIFEQFPKTYQVTREISQAWDVKISLQKGNLYVNQGHHCLPEGTGGIKYSQSSITYHFKWFGGVIERERKKAEIYKRIGDSWYQENERIVKYLESHGGRFDL